MLVLRRLVGQSIHIGGIKLTVIGRDETTAVFDLDDGESPAVRVTAKERTDVPIVNGTIVIKVLEFRKPADGVRFGIEADRKIPVWRSELRPHSLEQYRCLQKLNRRDSRKENSLPCSPLPNRGK